VYALSDDVDVVSTYVLSVDRLTTTLLIHIYLVVVVSYLSNRSSLRTLKPLAHTLLVRSTANDIRVGGVRRQRFASVAVAK
jgi:hypothetical protein